MLLFLDNLRDDVHTDYDATTSDFQTRLAAAAQEAVDFEAGPAAVVDLTGDPPIPSWDTVFTNTQGG